MFFFSSRRRHTRYWRDWSSEVCSSDLGRLMPNDYRERREGPIEGLRLPLAAWSSLHAQGIMTVDQLAAIADRLERLPGIGSNIAPVIREELARVSAASYIAATTGSEKHTSELPSR